MSLSDLQGEPRWYRWFIYILVAAFVAVTLWAGIANTFIGSVAPRVERDVVQVVGRGPVDLERMQCMWSTEKDAVERMCFDVDTGYAVAKKNGAYQQYCGLPLEIAISWAESDSMGKFLEDRINGHFACQ